MNRFVCEHALSATYQEAAHEFFTFQSGSKTTDKAEGVTLLSSRKPPVALTGVVAGILRKLGGGAVADEEHTVVELLAAGVGVLDADDTGLVGLESGLVGLDGDGDGADGNGGHEASLSLHVLEASVLGNSLAGLLADAGAAGAGDVGVRGLSADAVLLDPLEGVVLVVGCPAKS